jgi:CheY-like chemotaxis protein
MRRAARKRQSTIERNPKQPDKVAERAMRVSSRRSSLRAQPPSHLVLSVDDEATVLFTREHLLRAEGYSVVSASDGKQALELFSVHPAIELVLLDYAMPGWNGLLVARQMKRLRPQVPIVMVTGDLAALAATQESSVDMVLAKGMEPGQFLSKIKHFLQPVIALGRAA